MDYGIIEMIPDSKTLYDINKTTNLSNYIIRENIHKSMSDIRKIFIKSCASNCVLGYMLGIGDRNLGNILVVIYSLVYKFIYNRQLLNLN